MAVLFITEFGGIQAYWTEASAQIVKGPPVAQQTLAIGTTSVVSSAFNANTSILRVHTDTTCSIALSNSTTATATATTMRLVGNQTEYFGVTAGGSIAVITNT